MRHYITFLLLLFAVSAFGQYPANPRKIRLGYQTSGAGLVHIKSGTPAHTPSSVDDAWMVLDTTNNVLYYYDEPNSAWENLLDDVVRDTVFQITNVPDTISISPLQGDIFFNAAADTMGVYDGNTWNVFSGGGGGTDDQTLSIDSTGAGGATRNMELTIEAGNTVTFTESDDQNAGEVSITDSGGHYTGTDVEAALQEAGDSLTQHRTDIDAFSDTNTNLGNQDQVQTANRRIVQNTDGFGLKIVQTPLISNNPALIIDDSTTLGSVVSGFRFDRLGAERAQMYWTESSNTFFLRGIGSGQRSFWQTNWNNVRISGSNLVQLLSDTAVTVSAGQHLNLGADTTSVNSALIDFPNIAVASNDTVLTVNANGYIEKTATDALPGSAGEANTASNQGVGGVGVFKQKTGVDLEFKNINAGSGKVSVTDDTGNNEIDIDVNEDSLTIAESQISDLSHFTPTDIDTDYGNEVVTSDWIMQGAGSTGAFDDYDFSIGDSLDYGGLRVGNAGIYRTSSAPGAMDFGGAVIIRQEGNLDVGNDPGIEFGIMEGGNTLRFAIPESGSGNATAMFRSITIAGPYNQASGNVQMTGDHWTTNDGNLDFDTGATGADLFVQDDLEVDGTIFGDQINESTPGSGVTIDGLLIQDGGIPEAAVTAHEAALTITESQISDLSHTVNDSTVLLQDSIIVSYEDGVETRRDTIRPDLSGVGADLYWTDGTTVTNHQNGDTLGVTVGAGIDITNTNGVSDVILDFGELSAMTDVQTNDYFVMHDIISGAEQKIASANLIGTMVRDTFPLATEDYLLMREDSSSALRRLLIDDLLDAIPKASKAYGECVIEDSDTDDSVVMSTSGAIINGSKSGTLSDFSHSAGRLTFTGTEQKTFLIMVQIHASLSSTSFSTGWEIRKNGTAFDLDTGIVLPIGATRAINWGITGIVDLTTNDYIEVFGLTGTSTVTATVAGFQMTITEL